MMGRGQIRSIQRGFSLVEIMVGLAIGMLAMVVVLQVFAEFEGGKRNTTEGADAQSNGAIALYMIERDIKMGGWGMNTSVYADCNATFAYCDGSASCGGVEGAIGGIALGAIQVTDGGKAPDTISAQYFANPSEDTFRYPATTMLRSPMAGAADDLKVQSVSGCKSGGMVLVSQGGNCTLMKITQIPTGEGADRLVLKHEPHDINPAGEYNPAPAYLAANGWPSYTDGAQLACFAKTAAGAGFPIFRRSYFIDAATRQLQRADNSTGVTNEPVAPEIIDLQAQYGIAAAGAQSISDWVDATGATWANPSNADRKRIKAVRIALVARSRQYEKPVDGACKTTTKETLKLWPAWASYATESYPADWQCYHYKVFETVVPMRNTIWGDLK